MSMIRMKRRKSLSSLKSQSELLPIVLIVTFALIVAVALASQNITGLLVSNEYNLDEVTDSENITSQQLDTQSTVENTTNAITEPVSTQVENNATSPQILINETNPTTVENITLNESVEIPLNETSQTLETNETIPSDENITITDNLSPTYSNFIVNNTNPKKDEAIEFSAFWQDDFGLDKWIFSWNASGGWENETYSFVSSYDENTQILTKEGWKYLKDLSYNDEVATLYGKEIGWEKPVRIISLPYDNGIYKIDSEIDLLITPDHEIYARVDNALSFVLNRIKDFLFGIDIEDFKFIGIQEAYELSKKGYYLTFLDEKLKPVYVTEITKETYKGEIFDLTIPNHIVLVKRFGKAVWSSNLNVKEAWSNITKVVPVDGVIGYRFYASDLIGNWKETEIGIIEVETNISQPIEVLNQSFLTVRTDKSNYTQNETVNIFGEVLINGTAADSDIDLNILFTQTPQYTQKIKAMSGSYSYSFLADFKQEGEYFVNVLAENLTNSTSFYYYFSNVTQKVKISLEVLNPKKITRGEITEVKATITNTGSIEAKNVLFTWKLPAGFEIISGDQTENCGTLESNTSCVSVITVQTSLATELGINEIKVVVNYE